MKLGEGSTPGPWHESDHGEICAGGRRVAFIQPLARDGMHRGKEDKANARLIAKAPLLVEAREVLKAVVDHYCRTRELVEIDDSHPVKRARALLAKLEAV